MPSGYPLSTKTLGDAGNSIIALADSPFRREIEGLWIWLVAKQVVQLS